VSDRSKKRYIGDKELKPESLMMSYGYDPMLSMGAVKSPIFQTSTFVFESAEAGKAFFEVAMGLREKGPSEELGLIYSRLNNPDLEILEDRLTLWDRADAAAVFDSGMGAISTTMFALLEPGDVLLYNEPVYGGTDYFIKHILTRFGIEVLDFHAGISTDEIRERIERAGVADRIRMILLETPANPTMAMVDIEECAELAKGLGGGNREVVVAVDNTFLGPLWQHPLKFGAQLVLYSATKYIGGHSDVIAGVCLGRADLVEEVRAYRTFFGSMAGPWSGWLLMRSLETLKMRMTASMKNARYVADFLAEHPKVDKVYYLGHLSEGDPQFAIYKKQCVSPGAMMAFDVRGGEAEAFRFLNALKLFKLAVSLGGTESLAEHPATMTHADVPPEERERHNIGDGLVRLSIGVEAPEDQIADIEQALEAV
jgi:methionine-gamma-lyase